MFSRARLVAFQMVRAWKGAEVGRGIAGNKAEMKYGGSNKRLSKRGAMFTPRESMQDCGVVRGTRVIPPGKRASPPPARQDRWGEWHEMSSVRSGGRKREKDTGLYLETTGKRERGNVVTRKIKMRTRSALRKS